MPITWAGCAAVTDVHARIFLLSGSTGSSSVVVPWTSPSTPPTAVRWGTVASADTSTLQAPFRSGITIEEYQLEPVARALAMPRVNLLIADDVGLGKTIEAGLVAQEMLLRHRARRIVVVCPAPLTLKWRDEMAEKFGLDFTVLNATALQELRRSHGLQSNPFTVRPRTIISPT
jgi:SNF2 family DNA or RNA helicase